MSPLAASVTATYAVVLAVLALAAALRPPKRRAHLLTGAVVLEALLVGQAVLSVWSLLQGHRPADPATHVGYLACSVLLLPLLVLRPDGDTDTRWDDAVLAVAAVALAVVAIRAAATWAA